jgi:type I restriction enzyme, S subunit
MTWEMAPIGAIARVQGGYSFKSSDWQEAGVPVVKIANVRDGYLDLSGCSFVSDEIARQASAFLLAAGDILIGMTGYVGSALALASATFLL